MNTFATLSHDQANRLISHAVLAGCQAEPANAAEAVVDAMSLSFGPVIAQIVALLKQGITQIPAVLAALAAAGYQIPAWLPQVVSILTALLPLLG